MKKRRKFDEGGSVMDKPVADMRDPVYRKQLERRQALETSAPELMLLGPAGAARAGLRNILTRSAKPTSELTKNITIGQNVGKPGMGIPKELRDAIKEIEKAQELSGAIMRGGAKATGSLALDIPALEARRRGRSAEYKKGGKISSASKRADGCACRGKTRGRVV